MNMIINTKAYGEGYGTILLTVIFATDIFLNFFVEKEIDNPEKIIIERKIK